MDRFFYFCGFTRHKQSYRGKGFYFSVGGYDITKSDAKQIYKTHEAMSLEASIEVAKRIRRANHLIEDKYDVISVETVDGIIKELLEEHRKVISE